MNAGVRWRAWGAALLDRLLPPSCLACGMPVAGSPPLCNGCAAELPRNHAACRRCALPLPAGQAGLECGRCLRRPPLYSSCRAPFVYADPLDRWLSGLKFQHDLAAGRLLSELLAQSCADDPPWAKVDAVIAMPLHPQRLRERGYNQVIELLRPLRGRFDLPLRPHWILRQRATVAQSDLSAGQRRRNLRGAFQAGGAVQGQRILLVDDVITTGSTVAEASRSLLRAGAVEVRVLALARVPRGSPVR